MRKKVGVWRLVFMAFSLIAVTLGTEIVFLGIQKLSFGRPGASILPSSGPFCQLGDDLGDYGSSRNDTLGSGDRFLVISG